MTLDLLASDWLDLMGHFMLMSLLAVGGAITTAPDLHRYLVNEQQWLSDPQFNAAIALGQAAPGPNVMFVSLLGWQVGLNAATQAGWATQPWVMGLWGAGVATFAILVPSCTLTYVATQWAQQHQTHPGVRAFKSGLAPIVTALLLATGWLITAAHQNLPEDLGLWAVTAVSTLLVWRTRVHLLVLLSIGAVLGALGWI